MNILRLALLLAAITVSPPASSERLQSFSLLNIYIGQPLDDVKRLHPSIVCEASCLLENQKVWAPRSLVACIFKRESHPIGFQVLS